MKFLEDLGFNQEEIKQLENSTPEKLSNVIKESEKLITYNIKWLKDYGVANYKEVVINYLDMFLMDPTNFQNIFIKYEKEDLIDKIAKNVAIVEHL